MMIAIAGFDTEGRSSYDYFLAQGHELTILDQKQELDTPVGASIVLGPDYLAGLDRFDLIIRTAGLPPSLIFKVNPGLDPTKVTTQVNEFLKLCPSGNVVGVTGTKGKGTTSTLIAKMLEAAGFEVQLAGNIGVPALNILPLVTTKSCVVLELSSFQLIDLQRSPSIAVCLMVVPEHLNWHANMNEYVIAKSQLFDHQTASDLAIYFAENESSVAIAAHGVGRKLPFYTSPGAEIINGAITIGNTVICQTSELIMLGEHNWQNACAAVTAASQLTSDTNALRSVLTTFSGLPFRIELRRTVSDITYFNDSFASVGGASIAAIAAITGPKVMIIGGFDRGLDLQNFAKTIQDSANNIRHVLLIGQSARRMADNLESAGFNNFTVSDATSMSAIVAAAAGLAQSGDAVVLSPGFPS